MPGKGQRRREKNYKAAHERGTHLAPPPKQRELDALPSKLRRLIAIQGKQSGGASSGALGKQGDFGAGKKNKAREDKDKKTKDKEQNLDPAAGSKAAEIGGEDGPVGDGNVNAVDGTKGKRKRGKVMDLRFKELEETVKVSKKQKRKNYLDEKKKKRKTTKTETHQEFPGREKVKFGEVVEAPPKLSFPKVKTRSDISREMLRKDVIENYRNIKGWTSRPGLQLQSPAENASL